MIRILVTALGLVAILLLWLLGTKWLEVESPAAAQVSVEVRPKLSSQLDRPTELESAAGLDSIQNDVSPRPNGITVKPLNDKPPVSGLAADSRTTDAPAAHYAEIANSELDNSESVSTGPDLGFKERSAPMENTGIEPTGDAESGAQPMTEIGADVLSQQAIEQVIEEEINQVPAKAEPSPDSANDTIGEIAWAAPTLNKRQCQVRFDGLLTKQPLEFYYGSAVLRADAYPALDRVAGLLERCPFNIEISGHSDDEGDEAFNWRLSEARAMAVRNYLNNRLDTPIAKLTTKGYGETKPLPGEGKKQNRRVEFVVGESSS